MTDINNGGGTMGMHDNSLGWVWRWIPDSYFIVDRGYSQFANSARAPIFYDSDNTGYYLNPASTSFLYQLDTANNGGTAIFIGNQSVSTSNPLRINFHTDGDLNYYIGKPAGAWTQPLNVWFYTGVTIASHHSYNAGTRIYNIATGNTVANFGNGGDNIYLNYATYCPIMYDSANTAYYFDGSATGDSIRVAGDVVAYYSDERLKDIKCNISDALSKVMTLNGFYYEPNKIAQSFGYEKKLQVGLSAQQVETVLPEVIKDAPIGNGYKTLDYSKLVPLLVEAIKEQQKQIDELKTKLK
jgi:hypothetical protein